MTVESANATQKPSQQQPQQRANEAEKRQLSAAEISALIARLDATEKAIKERDREIESLKEAADNPGLKVLRDAQKPYTGPDGGYLFKIYPRDKNKYPHLTPFTHHACDESEMKRFYCATREAPAGSGKRLDSSRIDLIVDCLEEGKRRSYRQFCERLANIRTKITAGIQVSREEQSLVDQAYARLEAIREVSEE